MRTEKIIRGSSMDRLFSCPPSVLADGPEVIRITTHNEAASLGKAVHDCLAAYISVGYYDLPMVASAHGLSGEKIMEEARKLISYAVYLWDNDLGKYFPKLQTEAGIDGPLLTVNDVEYKVSGTVDAASPAGANSAIFLDWKSGYIDTGHHQQMAAYAYLLWNFMGRPTDISITGVLVYIRHKYYRVLKYTTDSILQWEHDLTRNVLGQPDKYSPSPHCRYCDMFTCCKARVSLVQGSINELIGPDPDNPDKPDWVATGIEALVNITEENKNSEEVGDLVHNMAFRIRLCKQSLKRGEDIIRETVERVGPIPIGCGFEIAMKEVEVRALKPTKALPILRARISESHIQQAMKLSLNKLLDTYADNRTGKRSESREKLMNELFDADAVQITVQHRITEQEIEQETSDGINGS